MTHRTLSARAFVAVAVLTIWALGWALGSAPVALAAAKGPGITGTVVNGTSGKPAAGLAVTLHLFSDQAELGSQTATTDVHGAFSFPQPSADAKGYQVAADYKGGRYQTTMAALTPGKQIDVGLKVYETTTDPAKVSQSSWILWVDRAGSQSCTAGVCVQHDFQWTNGGNTAYSGSKKGPDGSAVVTSVPLAQGAKDFQFLGTYLDTPGKVQGSTYVNSQPIVPGTSSATVRYDLATLTQLTLPVDLPTTSFELYVASGVGVKADGLTPSGQFTDQGVTYQRFVARNLRSGDTIQASLSGIAAGKKGSPILLGILAGVLVVLVGGLSLWKISRRAGAPRRKAPKGRPAVRRAATGSTAPISGTRRSAPATSEHDTKSQVDLLIEEIAAFDLAYERGLLEQRTYQSLRADAKRRLKELSATGATGRSSR